MDVMILFLDSVRICQFAKKNRSESFVQSRFRRNVYSGKSWSTVLSSSFSYDRANGHHNTVVRAKNDRLIVEMKFDESVLDATNRIRSAGSRLSPSSSIC